MLNVEHEWQKQRRPAARPTGRQASYSFLRSNRRPRNPIIIKDFRLYIPGLLKGLTVFSWSAISSFTHSSMGNHAHLLCGLCKRVFIWLLISLHIYLAAASKERHAEQKRQDIQFQTRHS
jgi:hypothetical protein